MKIYDLQPISKTEFLNRFKLEIMNVQQLNNNNEAKLNELECL